MNSMIESLYHRKSMRAYEDRPIPDDLKWEILNAAVQAPSAGCHAGIWLADTAAEGQAEAKTLRYEIHSA